MEAVLISIRPAWCELIANGAKTIEIRKSAPKLETPFKCYIYCTNKKPLLVWGDVFRGDWETEFTHLSGYSRKDAEKIWDIFNGKVLGEFVCDECSLLSKAHYGYIERYGRVSKADLEEYMGLGEHRELEYSDGCYGWHISDLVIYDEPKLLSEFHKPGYSEAKNGVYGWTPEEEKSWQIARAPQSWCYVSELYEEVE